MATISERLAYVLTFDTSSGIKSVEKFGKAVDDNVDRKLDKVGLGMQKFGASAVAFAGVAGVGLYKLAGSASDLAESVNAVNVTFGDQADEIKKLGEEAARSVGLSKTEFNGLAVQFSSFAKTVAGDGGDVVGTMDDLTTRAADFASVMNLDVAEAARVFQSGLAGETEPLKKFGIDLSAAAVGAYAVANGISDSAASMTEAEKVQARYGLLMQQTAQMQGDFANTSDGAANQQRILKAELSNLSADIGAGVLPMFTSLVSTMTKLTGAFSSLSPEAKSAIGTFATLGVGLLAMAGTVSFAIGKLIVMRENLQRLGRFAAPAAAGVGVAAVAIAGLALHSQKASADAEMLAENVREISRASDEALLDTFNRALLEAVANGEGVNSTLTELAETQLGAAKRVVDLAKAKGEENEITRQLEAAINAELDARKNAEASQAAETAAVEANTDALDDNEDATVDATEARKRSTDAIRDAIDATNAMVDATLSAIDSSLGFRNAQADAGEAITDYYEKAGDATTTTQDLEAAQRDAEGAILSSAAAAVRLAEDQATAAGATFTAEDRANTYRAELFNLAQYTDGPLREALQRYIDQLNSVPRSIYTNVGVTRTGDFTPTITGKRAAGGPVSAGGAYLVGENGPEILQMGSTGGNVIPNNAIGGGGGITINVQGLTGPQVADDIVNKIVEYKRRNGGLPW